MLWLPSRRALSQKSKKIRSVLSEIRVIVTVKDGFTLVGDGQLLATSLAVSIVFGSAIDLPVGRLMDERSGPGIGTDGGGCPETTAEVDRSELIGICQNLC